MHAELGGEPQIVDEGVAGTHGIHAVGRDAVESECSGCGGPVDIEPRPGECAAAEGALPRTLDGKHEAAVIAVEHPRVRQQVMRQPHRLRPLQMGVPRHQRVEMLARACDERLGERLEGGRLCRAVLADPQQRVGDHLIVATAAGVQAPTRITGDLREATLDGGVDVLVAGLKHEGARLHLRFDGGETRVDRCGVL